MTQPMLIRTKNGWLARGDGWTVHGATEEEALWKFEEAERRHREIEARPPFYERIRRAESAQL